MTSDEALMLEFQGGSRAGFEELFARYHKPLVSAIDPELRGVLAAIGIIKGQPFHPSVVTEAMKRLEEKIVCAADVQQVAVN